jgi:hypothetical protein
MSFCARVVETTAVGLGWAASGRWFGVRPLDTNSGLVWRFTRGMWPGHSKNDAAMQELRNLNHRPVREPDAMCKPQASNLGSKKHNNTAVKSQHCWMQIISVE